jgi:SAM-dependent methyltransferase
LQSPEKGGKEAHKKGFIEEVTRVLRPGGALLLIEHDRDIYTRFPLPFAIKKSLMERGWARRGYERMNVSPAFGFFQRTFVDEFFTKSNLTLNPDHIKASQGLTAIIVVKGNLRK